VPKSGAPSYETTVRARKPPPAVTRYEVQKEELRVVPGTFGDPLRVVQNLPGVARSPFGLGALIIRGSSPNDSGIFVEGHRIHCSHYDAYRFFTPEATGLNSRRPTLETRVLNEQPGCLHAGMDVYKWAHKMAPFTSADLVADCFALAREIRELDMRASPYDLTAWGYSPVTIETPSGKAEYVRAQRDFGTRATLLRQRLIAVADEVLRAA